jgi:hypothetical protein
MAEYTRGQEVWSKKLWFVWAGPEQIGYPIQLQVTKARRHWRCDDCGQQIEKGELHGGYFYAHYCLACVTDTEPPQVRSPLTGPQRP